MKVYKVIRIDWKLAEKMTEELNGALKEFSKEHKIYAKVISSSHDSDELVIIAEINIT